MMMPTFERSHSIAEWSMELILSCQASAFAMPNVTSTGICIQEIHFVFQSTPNLFIFFTVPVNSSELLTVRAEFLARVDHQPSHVRENDSGPDRWAKVTEWRIPNSSTAIE